MSLDNIQLPPQLVRELFKKSLIASKTENVAAKTPGPQTAAPKAETDSIPAEKSWTTPLPVTQQSDIPAETSAVIPPVSFLGKNQRQTVILVDNPQDRHLPDGQLGFLMKLLGACQLTLADVAVVNVAHDSGFNHAYFKDAVPANLIIGFGVTPTRLKLPVDFPMYQKQGFDQRSYVHAPTLTEVENDKAEKIKLWAVLKTLFQL